MKRIDEKDIVILALFTYLCVFAVVIHQEHHMAEYWRKQYDAAIMPKSISTEFAVDGHTWYPCSPLMPPWINAPLDGGGKVRIPVMIRFVRH